MRTVAKTLWRMVAATACLLATASAEKAYCPYGNEIVADQLLVKMRSDVALPSSGSFHGSMGAQVIRRYPLFPSITLVKLARSGSLEEAIEAYKRSPAVEAVSFNYVSQVQALPDDPRFVAGLQYGLSNTGQLNGLAGADISAPAAWDIAQNLPSVVVAVVDTGVRYTHEDLAASMWVNPGEIPGNGIDDDQNGYIDDVHGINAISGSGNPMDDKGHGTHVAGILGAVANNGIGMAGVAWNARIMALKFLNADGRGSDADAIECINYAIANGAKIINNSWGHKSYNAVLEQAIRDANAAGIYFVAAAGNESNDNDRNPNYPASYDIPNVVSVTATDKKNNFAAFANFGENSVDIAAPGVSISSAYADSDSSYRTLDGTSMATPYVSGALALLVARFPDEPMASIYNRLLASADILPSLARRCRTGGRLNLARALELQAPSPINDAFASSTALRFSPSLAAGFNATATVEPGEPLIAPQASGKTIWWNWMPSHNGLAEISTIGSDFHTALAVYRGGSFGAFATMGSARDDAVKASGASLTFQAVAGEVYRIAVDGLNGETGYVSLNIGQSVPNDNFANRTEIVGTNVRVASHNASGTKEPGEPAHGNASSSRSVWWTWTAPESGNFTFSTSSSNSFDTILALYVGDSLAALEPVASDDDSGLGWSSELSIVAYKGQRFQIAVDGWNGSFGSIALTIANSRNDNFFEPRAWITDTFSDLGYTGHATKEAGEPGHGDNAGGKSLWWEWTSTRTGQATISTFGSDFDTTLGVYQGSAPNGLTSLYQSDDDGGSAASRVLFNAVAGQTYLIAVDGYRGPNGLDFGLVKLEAFVQEDPAALTPVIASLGPLTGSVGVAFQGKAQASQSPQSYAATGLPPGLAMNASTGSIYGAPTQAGLFLANLKATNAYGTSEYFAPIEIQTATSGPKLQPFVNQISKAAGESVVLNISVEGPGPISYQWKKDGQPIPGAVDSSVMIQSLSESTAGNYEAVVSNASGSVSTGPIRVSPQSNYLLSISSRGFVGGGSDVMITGFTVTGSQPKQYLIRAMGPSLTGFNVSGVLEKPLLTLYQHGLPIGSAGAWKAQGNQAAIAQAAQTIGAFAFASDDDSAMLVTLNPGSYGAIVSGAEETTGVALAEVYDLSGPLSPQTRLLGISTRQYVGVGDDVAIAGFSIVGTVAKRVLIRVVGPGLAVHGVDGVLADPVLALYQDGSSIHINDNWEDEDPEALRLAFAATGTEALAPGSKDAAVVKTLSPGAYGVVVNGRDAGVGVCLLEVYEF